MEWISIKKELPVDGVDVLCLWEHGYWSGDIPRMSVDRIQHHGSGVRDFQSNYIHCYTHWRPLPPPHSSHNSDDVKCNHKNVVWRDDKWFCDDCKKQVVVKAHFA